MRSRFALVVFDLDGTLIDSRRDLAESINVVLEESGCSPQPEDAIGRMVGQGAATLVRRAFAASASRQPPNALDRFLAVYNERLLRFTRPYPGVPAMVEALSSRAALAVLTNKPTEATLRILDGLALRGHFHDRIVGGDGPYPRKPDPGALLDLMSRVDAGPAGTLVVGDSIIDWQTAQNAGVAGCIARYGFGFEEFPMAEVTKVDFLVEQPADLSSIV